MSKHKDLSFYAKSLFVNLVFSLICLAGTEVAAQMCVGTTAYVVRDEKGNVMSREQLEKVSVKVSGTPLTLRHPSNKLLPSFYEYDYVTSRYSTFVKEKRRISFSNPLAFDLDALGIAFCGKLGDLTLRYKGKEMRLLFDISNHNTYYEIDSLPFRQGTFHLKSLRCDGNAKPPMIDNNTKGKCLVSAGNWEDERKSWIRQLQVNEFWTDLRINEQNSDCFTNKIEIISTLKDWAEKWEKTREIMKSNPEFAKGIRNPLPPVNFETEIVLAIQTPPSRLNLIVDKKGNLSYSSPAIGVYFNERRRSRVCENALVSIYRSGVKTIEGKPLPPPSALK